MVDNDLIVDKNDVLLITGSNGFIGIKVVETLLNYGFTNLRCFVRASSDLTSLKRILGSRDDTASVQLIVGNLLARDDCEMATRNASVVYHLAAGRGEKSYPDAFLNSVVTTRNLLDAVINNSAFERFVNVSSFTVYSNKRLKPGALLDEGCEIEGQPELRGQAYCYAKVRQEEMVLEYQKRYMIPLVILRPGVVYGPGNKGIHGRIGINTFGIFLHLGGHNTIPLTYVDNCADAIVLAGIKKGVENEIFNIVDNELPTSRKFLQLYKDNVGYFRSIYVPKSISYLLCCLWEMYSKWSKGQLPPVFNRKRWSCDWKGNKYSNEKLKRLLGWNPRIPFDEATRLYFAYSKQMGTEG